MRLSVLRNEYNYNQRIKDLKLEEKDPNRCSISRREAEKVQISPWRKATGYRDGRVERERGS